MTSTNGKEIYYFDPARDKEKLNTFNPVKEIQKAMKAYKLASSGENTKFSASHCSKSYYVTKQTR